MRPTVELAREPKHPVGNVPLDVQPNPDQIIQVTMILRGASGDAGRQEALHGLARQLPHQRRHHTPRSLAENHGALEQDLARVRSFTAESGFITRIVNRAARSVTVSSTLRNFERAFHIDFLHLDSPHGPYRSHQNPVHIPKHLQGIIQAVVGLDNRAVARHQIAPVAVPGGHVDIKELAARYEFPPATDGSGQLIGVIELGGGFHVSDLKTYFESHGVRRPGTHVVRVGPRSGNLPLPIPKLRDFVLALAAGRAPDLPPADLNSAVATLETTMDVELIGALANGASMSVYFAPQTNGGLFHALAYALDPATPTPNVISISWAGPEDHYEPGDRLAIDSALEAAALCGITVCCASGDNGDGSGPHTPPQVTYPASSPLSLACGGTSMKPHLPESVWSETLLGASRASGGGVSALYDMPFWQQDAGIQVPSPGRGVPDVAAKADLQNGLLLHAGGEWARLAGGTSAAAPIWAALIARINQALETPVGYLTPLLYRGELRSAFHDIHSGTNGAFQAGPGWDPCTGWGSPKGRALLAALRPY